MGPDVFRGLDVLRVDVITVLPKCCELEGDVVTVCCLKALPLSIFDSTATQSWVMAEVSSNVECFGILERIW